MLMACDFTPMTMEVARRGQVPVLPAWGRFDRLVPARTGHEFGELVGRRVQWVFGGHSWMIARPGTQLDLLRRTDDGEEFMAEARERAALLKAA